MFIRCSRCGGGAFIDPADSTRLCAACRPASSEAFIADKPAPDQPGLAPQPEERPDLNQSHADRDAADFMAEPNIRRTSYGENLAVLALLAPIAAQGLTLACQFDVPLQWTTAIGMVVLTALLLAIDAAFLGRTDYAGVERVGPIGVFIGVCLFWVVFYPWAFFRRRHFGRPNLGPLALLVALFVLAAPYLIDYARLGVVGSGVPLCTSQEVKTMVKDMIRTSPIGAAVVSIDQFQETHFDDFALIRKGQCRVKVKDGTFTAAFTVKIVNPKTGAFQVDVAPLDWPPFCTEPGVIAVIEKMIRAGPNGPALQKTFGHVELRFNAEAKTRHGRCQATFDNRSVPIDYRIFWDERTGQYLVDLEP